MERSNSDRIGGGIGDTTAGGLACYYIIYICRNLIFGSQNIRISIGGGGSYFDTIAIPSVGGVTGGGIEGCGGGQSNLAARADGVGISCEGNSGLSSQFHLVRSSSGT